MKEKFITTACNTVRSLSLKVADLSVKNILTKFIAEVLPVVFFSILLTTIILKILNMHYWFTILTVSIFLGWGLHFYRHRFLKFLSFSVYMFVIITYLLIYLFFGGYSENYEYFFEIFTTFFDSLHPHFQIFASDVVINEAVRVGWLSAPNNFLFNFYNIYSAQDCGAFDDFIVIASGYNETRLVGGVGENFTLVDWTDVTYLMDADSNPIFFSYYNLNFFRHELLGFLASILILFISIFFFPGFKKMSKSIVINDHDVLYRLSELMIISILVHMHYSEASDYVKSVENFFCNYAFNNLFIVSSHAFIFKDVLLFIFLFFIFFFRFRYFLLNKKNSLLIEPTAVKTNSVSGPIELPYLLLTMLTFSMLIIVFNDLSILLIALEGLTFITAVIIAFDMNETATFAAIKYFTMGVASSGLLAISSCLTYGLLLSLDLKTITNFFLYPPNTPIEFLPVLGFTSILVFLSFSIKLSIFPGNFWVLDIYSACNLPTISLLVLLKSVYFLAFAKLYYSLYIYCIGYVYPLIIAASLGSMLFSAYGLLLEQNIKQFIAYSSTGQFGFLLLTLVCHNDITTVSAILMYLAYYITVMIIFFFSVIHITTLRSIEKFSDIQGASGSNIVYFFLIVSLLSLAGLPPFLGFFAKINILVTIASTGFSPTCLFVAFILNIAMTFGYLRVVRILYFNMKNQTIDSTVDLSAKNEAAVYNMQIVTSIIESDFFFKISHFMYSGVIYMLVFIHVFGIYFFSFFLTIIADKFSLFFF